MSWESKGFASGQPRWHCCHVAVSRLDDYTVVAVVAVVAAAGERVARTVAFVHRLAVRMNEVLLYLYWRQQEGCAGTHGQYHSLEEACVTKDIYVYI
jgi:hypothetical protein